MNEHREPECGELQRDLLLRSSGELNEERLETVESHLERCADCQAVAREMALVDESYRGSLQQELEDDRWRQMVAGASSMSGGSQPSRSTWLRIAAAVAVFAGGVVIGVAGSSERGDLRRLEDRLATLETSVLISRLRPASSAERLDALTDLGSSSAVPPEAWVALLVTLESDPSPNVRLAAVDALRRMETIEPVVAHLESLLLRQDSDVIAAELIELAVEHDLRQLRGALSRLAESSPSTRLREVAAWAIDSLEGRI